jgi:hypothetical protein
MNTPETSPIAFAGSRHPSPPLGIVAIIFTLLFAAGLYLVVSVTGGPHFPLPWESSDTIAAYFQGHTTAVRWCAFLEFGAAIPLGIFTATIVSRLQFLKVRAAGIHIALFGGMLAAFDTAVSSQILGVMAHPDVAQNTAILRALYDLMFSFGGVGFSVPMGIFMAGICVPAAFRRLLPKWLVVFGLALVVIGELSSLSLLFPKMVFLSPLTRFPSFIWLIAAGFAMPKGFPTNQNKPMQQKEII